MIGADGGYGEACNYNPVATFNDGNCTYHTDCYNCEGEVDLTGNQNVYSNGNGLGTNTIPCDADDDGVMDLPAGNDDCIGTYDQCGICNGPGLGPWTCPWTCMGWDFSNEQCLP